MRTNLRRLGLSALILLAIGTTVVAGSSRPGQLVPAWMPAGRLSVERDRILARDWLRSLGFCPKDAADCPDLGEASAAVVPLGPGRDDLLILRTASHGTCGAFEFAVLGPVQSKGGRKISPGEDSLFDACGEKLSVRPRAGAVPDLVVEAFVERYGPRGPAVETTRWRWSGDRYAVDRLPHNR